MEASMVSVRILLLSSTAIVLASGQINSPLANHAFDTSNAPRRAPATTKVLPPEQRGDVFMARKMYREAIDAYREGDLKSPVTWNKIGIAYHQLGDYAAARKNYERSIKIDKKYADGINNVGTIFYAQKRYRTAISRYKKALSIAPETASFWSNLGTAYYSRGKFEAMTTAYQKALELDPNIFEHRGTIGTELQDRTVADRARYHYELARMYAHAGKNELALRYLRKSLEEGFKDRTKLKEAPEFAELRETPEFQELLKLDPRVL
jgi:tetratricopeptide (TPR) repeat protein